MHSTGTNGLANTTKIQEVADELAHLMTFSQSITQAMVRTMPELPKFVFINMANITLMRHDSYWDFLKPGVKVNTLFQL